MNRNNNSFGWFISTEDKLDPIGALKSEGIFVEEKNLNERDIAQTIPTSTRPSINLEDELYDFDAMFSNQPLDKVRDYLPELLKSRENSDDFFNKKVFQSLNNTVSVVKNIASKNSFVSKTYLIFGFIISNQRKVVVSIKTRFGC